MIFASFTRSNQNSRLCYSIFHKFVQNLKQEASKDHQLQNSLAKFEQSLTDVGRNRAIVAAKHFLRQAKEQVFDKNSQIVQEFMEKTHQVRQKANEKLVDPLAKAFKSDPIQRRKMIQARRESLKRDKPKNPMDSLGNLFVSSSAEGQQNTFASSSKHSNLQPKENLEVFALICIPQPPPTLKERISQVFSNSHLAKSCTSLSIRFAESNNIFVYVLRSIFNSISERFVHLLLRENETARAIRLIRSQTSPNFALETFVQGELHNQIIPQVMQAFLNADLVTLKRWTSESTFNLLKANLQAMKQRPGLQLEGEVFDLRDVTLRAVKILDEERPVMVVSFKTQQIMLVKDGKTGEIVHGDAEKLEKFEYHWALTVVDGIWKIVEMNIQPI